MVGKTDRRATNDEESESEPHGPPSRFERLCLGLHELHEERPTSTRSSLVPTPGARAVLSVAMFISLIMRVGVSRKGFVVLELEGWNAVR